MCMCIHTLITVSAAYTSLGRLITLISTSRIARVKGPPATTGLPVTV